MWSETVGLRTRPVWDQKSVLVLLFRSWLQRPPRTAVSCKQRSWSCYFGLGFGLVSSSLGRGLGLVMWVLVLILALLFWSWSCKQRSSYWSWSCYFGLGLKNLVLFTSLANTADVIAVIGDCQVFPVSDHVCHVAQDVLEMTAAILIHSQYVDVIYRQSASWWDDIHAQLLLRAFICHLARVHLCSA